MSVSPSPAPSVQVNSLKSPDKKIAGQATLVKTIPQGGPLHRGQVIRISPISFYILLPVIRFKYLRLIFTRDAKFKNNRRREAKIYDIQRRLARLGLRRFVPQSGHRDESRQKKHRFRINDG